MAFDLKKLRKISAGDGTSNAGKVKTFWTYVSDPDTLAGIQLTGYFNEALDIMFPGDRIFVSTLNGAGGEDEMFVVNEVSIASGVEIRSAGALVDDTSRVATLGLLSMRFNPSSPPAPMNFDGDLRIVDAFLIHDVASTGSGTTLNLKVSGTTLGTFTFGGAVNNKRTELDSDDIDAQVNNVTSADTLSWDGIPSAADSGEGFIYVVVVKTQ